MMTCNWCKSTKGGRVFLNEQADFVICNKCVVYLSTLFNKEQESETFKRIEKKYDEIKTE